ncbi:tetratricopeptide repeat-containing sulfotransferase family protein [Novosphingobium sediminicola]|uniref:Tetratricopeptide (TPR) repeat protein n=1 Tax=Novosphingobium sediminicola TaxID=563162 RepID=A0A7W6CEA4_9SPHN|nr:tetratricopeptide (TPR) repeat protein [Novosphingobium sediminicola]
MALGTIAARPSPRPSAQAVPGAALAEAARLLESDPAMALARAETLIKAHRSLPPAELIAAQALRRMGKGQSALTRLIALDRAQPGVPPILWELAQAAGEMGDGRRAVAALEALTRAQPQVASGWYLLAREWRRLGEADKAWRADLSAIHASSSDPELVKAALAMNAGELDAAEAMLTARLTRIPEDASATRLIGEIHWRRGDLAEAMAWVEKALDMAPGFDLARDFLIRLLLQTNRLPEAQAHAETLCASPMQSPAHRLLRASVLVRLGDQEGAGGIYEALLADAPDNAHVWQNLGHVRKTLGDQGGAVEAYRRAIGITATMGEAWWSLANLKTAKFTAQDRAAMQAAIATGPTGEDLFHLHFALGKALEDAGDYAASFKHYTTANRLRRAEITYSTQGTHEAAVEHAVTFTAPFYATREGGCMAPDPIFILGLPRSGSTLVEQILSSHSMIEGTHELPEMMMIAGRLKSRAEQGEFASYGDLLRSLSPADRTRLGEEYIELTRVHRQTDRPLFIDKMPNNWQNAGLIRLILPRAKIIDARRHPMACCFSGWKQHFARGQVFTYDLAEIGAYYRDYVAQMAHFDEATPGAVHRVIYERMVADTQAEVARLLAYVGVDFEEACLSFWENKRAVRTASSEQVRRPIYRDGLEQWTHYADWLDPLRQALGPVTEAYPDPPQDWAAHLAS